MKKINRWFRRPIFCFNLYLRKSKKSSKAFILRIKDKETRKESINRILFWVKKNSLIGSVILLTWNTGIERDMRIEAEKENVVLKEVVSTRPNEFRDFKHIYWNKVKHNNDFRFVDLSNSYLIAFDYDLFDLLGKSNIEVAGETGRKWRHNDSLLAANIDNDSLNRKLILEPSLPYKGGYTLELISSKWAERNKRRDTTVKGFAIPSKAIIELLNNSGKYKVYGITDDTCNYRRRPNY